MSSNRHPSHKSRYENQTRSSVPQKRAADDEEDKWVADEDRFVLKQAKRKAVLRVRGGRAKPIDWLAVILRAIDKSEDFLDENEEQGDLEMVDPEGVFEGLNSKDLEDLRDDIETYLIRETSSSNREYWKTMKVVCVDRLNTIKGSTRGARGVGSVNADVDRMFSGKSYEDLEKLEKQIRNKLDSDEDIDVDYWEHLLKSLLLWKAKAKLRKVSQQLIKGRLDQYQQQQRDEASDLQKDFADAVSSSSVTQIAKLSTTQQLDPEAMLKIRAEDKSLQVINETDYLQNLMDERRKITKLGYIPAKQKNSITNTSNSTSLSQLRIGEDSTSTMYEREMAKGVNEDEEVFTSEEIVTTVSKTQWDGKHRPRKPRYFNRVQMGYEWNKYNQTHYDHDNPPPKVVQGYKFNIFYPDLIDKTKAPTYKIEREGGRKRGQITAPAGEEDTCLIRFMAGPPYEDIAFRIVDREWDYSAKRERGFKSSFDKGILQLHFQFKKIYYRK